MATSTNQNDYLQSLVKAGGGNGEWAKAQLASQPQPTSTTQPLSSMANNTTNPPATGYGGANYNTADAATRQSIVDNEAKLSDPAFRQSEIARTQGVIANRTAGNMDNTDQNNYLQKLMGMNQPAQPAVTAPSNGGGGGYGTQNNTSLINDIYNNNYNSQLQKIKDARDQALAGLAGQDDLINQNKISGLNSNDVMANQRQQSLKELMAEQGLGSSGDNVSAQIGIGTSQQQGANDINTNAGNSLKQLQATKDQIKNSANADDIALMQQLQAARGGQLLDDSYKQQDYGLSLANLMGSFNGQRTLAGQSADRNFALGEGGLTGLYNGNSTLAGKQANWNAYTDSVGMTGNMGSGPKSDWGQLGGTGGAKSYNAVQDAIKNGMSQQQIDQSASQFAQQMGYNYANMNANDKQAWAQIAISQQNANNSGANLAWAKDPNNPDNLYKNAQIDALKNKPAPKPASYDYEADPEFGKDLAHLMSNQNDASTTATLDTNAQMFIDSYGIKGYMALRKAAGL